MDPLKNTLKINHITYDPDILYLLMLILFCAILYIMYLYRTIHKYLLHLIIKYKSLTIHITLNIFYMA